MAREEMVTGSLPTVSKAKRLTWRIIFAWVLVVVVFTFAVSSIAYDVGQASKNEEVVKLEEKYEYGEGVRNNLRESRDRAEERSLRCLRTLDISNHYLSYKGDILYDIYLADTPEKMDKAKARVEGWYKDRESYQGKIDDGVEECAK